MPKENVLQDITQEDRAKFYSSVGCQVDLALATFRLEVKKTIPERE